MEQALIEEASRPKGFSKPFGSIENISINFVSIPATGMRGKNPIALVKALWDLIQGYQQSYHIIRHFQPDVLFVTGGYVCVPATLAAKRFGVPIIIYLPDIEPGLAIKFLARFANRVAITTPESERFFKPGLTAVTGYPVRADLLAQSEDCATDRDRKAAARRQLGLVDDRPVLMVFGGSRGARSLNQALTSHLEDYLAISQIIHVTGHLDEAWVQEKRAKLTQDLQAHYHVSAYLHDDMTTALWAADLVISRAGASVLGEFPAIGLPSILVPYPYAGAHQALNANYLAKHQAAIIINDVDIISFLRETVINTISNQEKLNKMSRACLSLAKPNAADSLARQILEVKNYAN
jgi:UDP-N-acetylglucosamine--N-acetylmuramyl-(pentapeptide) pyrophosphoryl-undecaprenol N-acetylglucosamine transferase